MDISIIDIIGEINNGIGVLLSLVVNDTVYEIAYWFDNDGNFRIVPEQKMLDKLGIDTIYNYEKLDSFLIFIRSSIDHNMILMEVKK